MVRILLKGILVNLQMSILIRVTDLVSLGGVTEKARYSDVVRQHEWRLASPVLHHTVGAILYQQVHYALCKHKQD